MSECAPEAPHNRVNISCPRAHPRQDDVGHLSSELLAKFAAEKARIRKIEQDSLKEVSSMPPRPPSPPHTRAPARTQAY